MALLGIRPGTFLLPGQCPNHLAMLPDNTHTHIHAIQFCVHLSHSLALGYTDAERRCDTTKSKCGDQAPFAVLLKCLLSVLGS